LVASRARALQVPNPARADDTFAALLGAIRHAWYLLTSPGTVLCRHTHCRDGDQTYDLLAALFDPRQIGATNAMWDHALLLCVAGPAWTPRTRPRYMKPGAYST
jgi:hypothetical protein